MWIAEILTSDPGVNTCISGSTIAITKTALESDSKMPAYIGLSEL